MKGCHWLGFALWGLAVAVVPAQDNQTISLELQDAPVTVTQQALADYRQLNLITAAGVDGNLTLRLDNGPWPQALALVLRMGNLSMTREGSVMMVSAELDAQEKQQHQQTLTLQQPLDSVKLALKNADAAEIAESLNAQRGALLGERGSVVADKRTNALLIRDTAPVLALLKKRVAEMDIPLAQVQLASYIVIINSENLHELGVRWGLAGDEWPAQPLRLDNFNVGLPQQTKHAERSFSFSTP